MGNFDLFEGGFNLVVRVEANLVHEVIEVLAVELPFDFGEDRFDRIEFRRVAHVEHGLDV